MPDDAGASTDASRVQPPRDINSPAGVSPGGAPPSGAAPSGAAPSGGTPRDASGDEARGETVGDVSTLYLGNILYAIERCALSLDDESKPSEAAFYRGLGRKLADAYGRSKRA